MSGPFIYIGTYSIKSDKFEEAKTGLHECVDLVETNEPRLIAFNTYLDEERSKVSIVQVHPDVASMEFHLKVITEHLSSAFDYLDTTESEQVYGTPTEALAESLREYADPGVPVTFMPIYEGGFTRTNAFAE